MKETSSDIFYKRLQFFLDKKSWSLSFLAQKAGICSSTVYSCRNNGRVISHKDFCKMCEALEITPVEFFMTDDDILLSKKDLERITGTTFQDKESVVESLKKLVMSLKLQLKN